MEPSGDQASGSFLSQAEKAFDPPLPSSQLFAAAEDLQYARIVKNSVLSRERFWKLADTTFPAVQEMCLP